MTFQGYQGFFLSEVAPYFLSNTGEIDPLEHEQYEVTHDDWARLERRRDELKQSELAPAGAWLEVSKCYQRKAYQVYWRAEQPVFNGKKRRYIGMAGTPKVYAAQHAIARRKELAWVERQLQILEDANADG